ncbi:uroporphyrinogen-III synthase [Motilimonas cestriensis]|uniref:Uroporphyrinogen-III synthase n=1 Tax=Motilimonas cestriensis TaxID=2742685 RepID=A0ABS8WCX0_9GAMM|nr:uroporphyrinogen-III synthase [Motilimonas cestriensis]MCE2596123.1 uroporphyrinogen-III synthase [Motilimonas cestriensis]
MTPLRILVTRPQRHQQPLIDALVQQGWFAIGQPLLEISASPEIESLAMSQHQLARFQFIIAISDNAVRYANNWLKQQHLSWPNQAQYLAVGKNTADCWQQLAQVNACYPESADSEGLIAMPALQAIDQSEILILKGNAGRDLIASSLQKAGAKVTEVSTYQRLPIPLSQSETLTKWQQNHINSVIITSGEILFALINVVPNHERNWLFKLNLIVISQRIAKLAREAGFIKVWIAQGASQSALIQCLHNIE